MTKVLVGITTVLSRRHREDIYLGQDDEHLWSDVRVHAALARLRDDLDEAQSEIEARNRQREVPYEYLLPANVLNSISL